MRRKLTKQKARRRYHRVPNPARRKIPRPTSIRRGPNTTPRRASRRGFTVSTTMTFRSHANKTAGATSSAECSAEVVELPPWTHDLTSADIQSLNALMPKLAGDWVCNIGTVEGGDVQACIARRGSWGPHRQVFIIARQGAALRLMISRFPYGPQPLGVYDSATKLSDVLGDTIGWCRPHAPAAAP
jgi:hypothetical protein